MNSPGNNPKTSRAERKGACSRAINSRFARALLTTFGLLLASGFAMCVFAAITSHLSSDEEIQNGGQGTYASIVWQSLKEGSDSNSALRAAGLLALDAENAPDWMVQEIIDLGGSSNAYANQDMSVVGVSIDGTPDDIMQSFLMGLSQKGWMAMDSGYSETCTLIKEGGECRWMMLDVKRRRGGLDMVMHIDRT